MDAFAKATSIVDLFERLETCEAMLRIYPDHKPSMFHYATMSKGEIDILRKITNVIRLGHVQAVERDALMLTQGSVTLPGDTVCIDCTASAVEKRPVLPIFQGDKLTSQLVRIPQPTFCAALLAYVKAYYENDVAKNKICTPVPFPDDLKSYPLLTAWHTSLLGAKTKPYARGSITAAWTGSAKSLLPWIHGTRKK